jgi:phage baseplate assembly protein W
VSDADRRMGVDLRLLEDIGHQAGRDRGSDLLTSDKSGLGVDLATLDGTDNLKQALLLRFLTPHGELTALGHPDYGSRLYELIGELNSQANRNKAKMFVLQSLAGEPRIGNVEELQVTQGVDDRNRVDIRMRLIPIASDTPLDLVFPIFLEGGAAS